MSSEQPHRTWPSSLGLAAALVAVILAVAVGVNLLIPGRVMHWDIVTDHRCSFTDLDEFNLLDIDSTRYRVVVVKLGYLFSELREIASLGLLALTPGTVALDLSTLTFNRVQRPMFPLDTDFSWAPPAPGQTGSY